MKRVFGTFQIQTDASLRKHGYGGPGIRGKRATQGNMEEGKSTVIFLPCNLQSKLHLTNFYPSPGHPSCTYKRNETTKCD